MSTLGRGTMLAGRYRLEQQLSQSEGSSVWRGVDTTLDRFVAIRIIAPRTAGEALDAARRAALIDDPRLVRLLDVAHDPAGADSTSAAGPHSGAATAQSAHPDEAATGTATTQTYVVSEWIEGQSLAELLAEHGPLPADRVRMMVGEAAQALAVAARSGLHHVALDPTSVLLTSDGAVRVHGLAVAAAAHTGAHPDGAAAERVDAVGLVALIYAGLTGHWPLPTDSHDQPLETAPMLGNAPVAPSQIVSGVPNDLDTLCTVTFGPGDDGPTSPAELAAQLTPWGAPATAASALNSNRLLADDLRQAPRRAARRFPIQLTPIEGQDAIPPAPRRATVTDDDWDPPMLVADDRPEADEATSTPDFTSSEFGTGEPTDRRRFAWLPIALIAALVVVGLVLAVWSLGRGQDQSATDAPTTSPSPTASATAGAPPKIVEVTAFDPEGGDGENDAEASKAADGDPSTTWRSSRYKTAAFGNLKDGLGLVVKLEEPATVDKVTVTVEGSGGTVEIRTATGPTLDGSQVVASGPAGGTLEKTLTPAPETQYLIIWFTELARVDGEYRAVVAEVGVA